MVKASFKLLYSCLCYFELFPEWATMVMGFRWQSNKILKAVIISHTINMVNLPTFRSWAISIFPYSDMFKNLMPGIGTWMVSKRKQNIAVSVLNPAAFPVRVFLALSVLIMATAAEFRMPIHPTATAWANLSVSLRIFIGVALPFSPLFFNCVCHDYIIAEEVCLGNCLMRQKPGSRRKGN